MAFIAGGIGIAPLLELIAQVISERGAKGAREPAPFLRRPHGSPSFCPKTFCETWAFRSTLQPTTAASATRGALPECLKNLWRQGDFRPLEIYSCGPLAMQYHVARWALSNDALAQLSMESLMACGIGACLGCALPASTPGDPESERFVHVCEDGPIFSAGSIKWNKILAQQTPPPTWLFS